MHYPYTTKRISERSQHDVHASYDHEEIVGFKRTGQRLCVAAASEDTGPEDGTIGWRIRQARLRKGLSLEGLARAVDVGLQSVWRLEYNKSKPASDNLIALARVLGVSPSWIMTGHEIVYDDGLPPALAEFLGSALGGDVTAEERTHLASLRFSHGDPTVKTYDRELEAYRSVKKYPRAGIERDEVVKVNEEAEAEAKRRGMRPLPRRKKR